MRLAANGAQRTRPLPEKRQVHVFGRSGKADSRATPGRERGGWAMSCVCVCVCVCVCSKKRTGTRLRSGPLPPATFLAYTQPGPPSKDDGGRTADGEAEHAAWKTSDDYGQKGIYVSLCLLLGKKANNFCVSPFWGDTRMPVSESNLIVF